MKKRTMRQVPEQRLPSGDRVFCSLGVPGDEARDLSFLAVETGTVKMGFAFNLAVGMQVKPRRHPAYVTFSVDHRAESPDGVFANHPSSIRVLNTVMTPAHCRKLASRLMSAAARAERADREPYPPPGDVVPPLGKGE